MKKCYLGAQELLSTKGIRSDYWKTWEKTTEMLPSTGQKLYEPNNSWLQNKQIEKGLEGREALLGIERVERGSQLAAAEWLPHESMARVTKKSGQDWTSFGLEENLKLYLMPEEALLLLELNCLELTWEGVTLSIQQAYRVLLESDRRRCNKDEYRVYSNLVRQGYRLQRFPHKDGCRPYEQSIRARQSSALKRRAQIHDPLNGFGMTRDRVQTNYDGGLINDRSMTKTGIQNEFGTGRETGNNPNSKPVAPGGTKEKFRDCESSSHPTKKLPSELYDNGVVHLPGPSNIEAKKSFNNPDKNSTLPTVISDEIFLGKLNMIANWPGARIQKNAKEQSVEENYNLTCRIQDIMAPRVLEMTMSVENSLDPNRAIHEVIELSDEEIEEIPQKMSRMEMLNLFPNVISKPFVAEQISKRYLPSHVWPQKVSNQYIEWKVSNVEKFENGHTCDILRSDPSSRRIQHVRCRLGSDESLRRHICTGPSIPGLRERSENAAVRQPNPPRNTVFDSRPESVAELNGNTVNYRNMISRRESCFHKDSFGRQNLQGKLQFLRGGRYHRQENCKSTSVYRLEQNRQSRSDISESSFKIVPGALSWAKTKAKWLDEKTITIEDEDCLNKEDSPADENEVTVLALPGKSLVNMQNVTSLAQVYEQLQIIKEATSKSLRGPRKERQADYCRISHNLYSTAHRFRKGNPGPPMYRIAVLRSVDTPLIRLGDMVGLQRNAKGTPVILACASQTSVTFAELGRVTIPDSPDMPSHRQLDDSL